ncbi:glycosyltransferase family 4 protein [Sphingobacterium phlebotomi]|uniref:Glycosyltransferase family 4 protein n=1 Tax=Sphingobacterium phlebotomi TaxID=2605433 RepID=A0A5D4HC75_9SPHI|nr:glycosyltransferase family 4 protein [Sphingobacterium phlebotomi]TYR38237.1 glycosyltransferase family 4 protein [Sphingobacterium phlebotomi]
MSKKKLLLISPSSFNLYQLILRNLEYLGYEVVHIEDQGYKFQYTSLLQRIYNFIRKVFLNDRYYKEKLKKAYISIKQREILYACDSFDIALVLRADYFKPDIISLARQKAKQMISFHFDGISRDPNVLEYVHFFDQFYVFDKDDLKKYPSYNLLYSPNFYLDYPGLLKDSYDRHYNVYYVSTFHESRVQDLIAIHQYMTAHYSKVKFVVVCSQDYDSKPPDYVVENMEIRKETVSFDEQLQHVANADIILDLVISDHKGFSFRILEGIKFGKKVITTNPKVIEADFFHPSNFFILTDDNYDDIAAFLNTPYSNIDPKIIEKYSFSSWLQSKIKRL